MYRAHFSHTEVNFITNIIVMKPSKKDLRELPKLISETVTLEQLTALEKKNSE